MVRYTHMKIIVVKEVYTHRSLETGDTGGYARSHGKTAKSAKRQKRWEKYSQEPLLRFHGREWARQGR